MPTNLGSVKVEGLRELGRQLDKLDQKLRIKALRSAMSQSMQPMVKAAKARAYSLRDSGALSQSIGRWSRAEKGIGGGVRVSVFLGPKSRDKKALALWNSNNRAGQEPVKLLTHGHLVEFGAAKYAQDSRPYLRPAFDDTRLLVVRQLGLKIRKQLDRVRG